MAATIESTSTAVWTTGASLTITKPSGLSVGDLMVAAIGGVAEGNTTPSGWTKDASKAQGGNVETSVFSKIANSTDVAASNFTFTSTSNFLSGIIYRISDATQPDIVNATYGVDDTDTASWTGSINPLRDDCVMIMALAMQNVSSSTALDTTTISGTNPTWSTDADDYTSAGSDQFFGCASATLDTSREITAYSIGAEDSAENLASVLVFYAGPVNISTDVNTQTVTTSVKAVESVTGSANVSGLNVQTITTSVLSAAVVVASNIWDYAAKSVASVWTNENESN